MTNFTHQKNSNLRKYFPLIIFIVNLYFFNISAFAQPLPSEINLSEQSPDSFLVSFVTTKGEFIMKSHRDWSPLACDRLYLLVKNGFYNGCVIYRVGPTLSFKGGFIVQFGMTNDEKLNRAWEKATLKDEPVKHPHKRGSVNFASGGPNTRTVQLAIALTPCTELDTVSYQGAIGFPTFAEVVEGIEIVDSFNRQYGNSVFEPEDSLYIGDKYFNRFFPRLDRILTAKIINKW